MDTILLRPADPARDFAQLAAWFTILEDELTTEASLQTEYEEKRARVFQQMAVDAEGRPLGFYWAARNTATPDQWQCYLFVAPEQRRQGVGGRLCDDLLATARAARARTLRISVADTCPECRTFAERRGFAELRHHFGMALDLAAFDDRPWDAIVDRLKGAGFAFTSMAELGNTEDAQRKLYALNDAASAATPGQEGEHPWASFEDFQKRVCQAAWYKPDGQIVAIDTATGVWAAMSAITRFEGSDYAYNLFTGVDARYRERKLGQAVKIHALRYARNVLKVGFVRTHHNTRNLPMIAIDRKLGYTMLPGTFLMERALDL